MSLSEPFLPPEDKLYDIFLEMDYEEMDSETFGSIETRRLLERRLVRKIDLRMSILVIMYIANYVDRNNAAAARLRGFEQDLHLQGQQFATLLSILYVGYIIMQIPSNMFLNWCKKPSIYLPVTMIVWGIISILTGITRSFIGALLTRFFLGFVECAFFPGALFLLSKWYKREEYGLRIAIFYCGNIISTAFGSLLASGILDNMQGKLGLASWRWLFFLEGGITIFVALCAIFILPDFPETTRWLSVPERRLAFVRMKEDVGADDQGETEDGKWSTGLKLAFTDWKLWLVTMAITSQVTGLSFSAYFPTLSATMGFNSTISLVLCAPPFIFAALLTFILCRHSDKTRERFWHIVISLFVGIIGFIIAIFTMNLAARYFSFFLMAQTYAGYVCLLGWWGNTFPRPPSKRAVSFALVNAFSSLGSIAGSYMWPSMWGPGYRYSFGICIACTGATIIMCLVLKTNLTAMNVKFEREEREKDVKESGFRYIT